MWTLILECGICTVSWYAELALRSRVSMSATGSVMVMAWWPSSPRFPLRTCGAVGGRQLAPTADRVIRALVAPRSVGRRRWRLPAGLGDTGQLATVRQHAEADTAQAEPAVDGPGPPAARAPGVRTDLILRRALRLGDQSFLRHYSAFLERESEPSQQRAAFGV